MPEPNCRKALAEQYNEAVIVPADVSTELPALTTPMTECPNSEIYMAARQQTIRLLVVLLITIGVLVVAAVGLALATGFVYAHSV